MKKFLLSLAIAALGTATAGAQLISATPTPLFQNSENIVLTYRPDDAQSNKELADLPESTKVYAHIGVITTASANDDDWKHAANWDKNEAKYLMTYKAANTYELNIGDLTTYFGLKSSEKVKKIAVVFRSADRKKEGKTSDGGNIYVDVYSNGINLTSSIAGSTVSIGDKATFDILVPTAANLSIKANGTEIAAVSNSTTLSAEYTFTSEGECDITAYAKMADGTVDEEKLSFTVFPAAVFENYPGGTPKMGAVANADGSVTFCLAAPMKQRVQIVGAWDNYEEKDERVMNCHTYEGNNYFWITIPGLDPDTKYPYYYIVDNSIRVTDPYGKLILDRNNDSAIKSVWGGTMPAWPTAVSNPKQLAVYWGNMNKYEWSDFEIPEHSQLLIYEMLFRDFTGTEGAAKGNGTVRQAIEKIPYLKELGVNAVELMPIMEFAGNNSWGYNTNFYFAPDKAYGSPEDYKDFIDICHRNGIAVILDIVFNQSDGLHPWYQMYSADSNPFYNAVAPHDYSVLNDWRQESPLVRQQWDDCLRYWLTEYNVDGFRFDLVKGLGDSDSYANGTEATNTSRINNMKRLHATITSVKPNGIHINEFLGASTEEARFGTDGQLMWLKVSDNAYKFAQGTSGGSLNNFNCNNTKRGKWGRTVAYYESHDEQRAAYLVGTSGHASVKGSEEATCHRIGSLAGQMLLSPGPKMIWQFGELCADQNTKNGNNNNLDPKTVVWSYLDNDNRRHVHDIYADLCHLRLSNPELFSEAGSCVTSGFTSAYTSSRYIVLSYGDMEVVGMFNPAVDGAARAVTATVSKITPDNCQFITGSKGLQPILTSDETGKVSVNLAPNTFAVFASKNVSGVDDIVSDFTSAPKASVFGGNGEIVIVGDYATAEVYDIQGHNIGRLNGLAKGIYIVRVDGAVAKVAVK